MKNRFLISLSIVVIILVCLGLIVFVNGCFLKLSRGKKAAIINHARNTVIQPEQEKRKQEENSKYVAVSEPLNPDESLDKEGIEIKMLIEKLGSDDLQVSQDAAEKLVNFATIAIPGLLDAIKGADIALKGQIVFLLGRIGDKDAVPALVQVLTDENSYIRRNAAEALGKIKDEAAISSLSNSLFDEDIAVRERSAWALGEIKDTRGVESLLNRMIDETDGMVKTSVVSSLGKIQDQRATLVLIKELKSQSDQLYTNEVVRSLGEVGDPLAINALYEHLEILRKYEPTEKMVIFQWQEAIKITEEAINKIKNKS